MTRWYAGVMAEHRSLDGFDYYMHMDTDSFLVGPVEVDPFAVMDDGGCAPSVPSVPSVRSQILVTSTPLDRGWRPLLRSDSSTRTMRS